MKDLNVWKVGGCVRDMLLGIEPKDIDYVVIGATPEIMISKGFKQVGADFPVFLHPETNEEYAMARREKKEGVGYNGFICEFGQDVSLEEDLARRDIRINAIAQNINTGEIFDPFNGQEDLQKRVIKHVSNAFAEDPVRVLRVARFVARYGFTVDSDTIELMKTIVPELNDVTPERIWLEIEKGLKEKHFIKMFEVLHTVGALDIPALKFVRNIDFKEAGFLFDEESVDDFSFTQRVVYVTKNSGLTENELNAFRIPSEFIRFINVFVRDDRFDFPVKLKDFHSANKMIRVFILNELRAFSDKNFAETVFSFIESFDKGFPDNFFKFHKDMTILDTVDTAKIAQENKGNGSVIKFKIFQARVNVLFD